MMLKQLKIISFILIIILSLVGCSTTKTVKTKQFEDFKKEISSSVLKEKIKNFNVYFTRPELSIYFEVDKSFNDNDLLQVVNHLKPVINVEHMTEIAQKYWENNSKISTININFYNGKIDNNDLTQNLLYNINTRYYKSSDTSLQPDNVDGYKTWYITIKQEDKNKEKNFKMVLLDDYFDVSKENFSIVEDEQASLLFKEYGWTLDYKIGNVKANLQDLSTLPEIYPSLYYFSYCNELSKDIGLDMNNNLGEADVSIYRIIEPMPEEFFPAKNCRAVVVKKSDKIIGAFISAGRHSTFNSCSLKGNSFEKVTGLTVDEWLAKNIKANDTEKILSKLSLEQIIQKYFNSLDQKNADMAKYSLSKKEILENLSSNLTNDKLYNEDIELPLTDAYDCIGVFDNLKSAKVLNIKLIQEPDENTKIFKVDMDLQYNEEVTINSGKQDWDCKMIYESPQTGWKIESFGH